MFVEEKGTLLQTIELSGRNLSGFLRAELTRKVNAISFMVGGYSRLIARKP